MIQFGHRLESGLWGWTRRYFIRLGRYDWGHGLWHIEFKIHHGVNE